MFARFSRLEEYTLPASVKTIGKNAFEYCTSLRAVVIPDTVDSLSNYCFQHCEGAESLTIPGDLDYNAVNIPFYNMKNLKHIYITPGKTGVVSVSQVKNPTNSSANISDGYTIHIMEGVTEIRDKVFANTKASRIEIADSITVIGTDAFAKKAYDKSTIPDYAAYKRSRYRESFRDQHREELKKHEATKAAFDALGGKAIPKVAELSKEYAALLEEKKQCYEECKAARQEMIDFQTAKRNVDVILGMDEAARKRQQGRNQEAEH